MIDSSEYIKEENRILKASNAALESEKTIFLEQINTNKDFEAEKCRYEQKTEQLQNELTISSSKIVNVLKQLDEEKSNVVNSHMSIEELHKVVSISINIIINIMLPIKS